jgi:2-keto-4-pentenoate hydratase/2-oxohepta-3-ene-1,7-dioic acid hydratase in catechol pathway
MAFPIPVLIEYISSIMTLEPGDLIATGTPAGVGRLHAGDVVEVEVVGVGTLTNPVEDE